MQTAADRVTATCARRRARAAARVPLRRGVLVAIDGAASPSTGAGRAPPAERRDAPWTWSRQAGKLAGASQQLELDHAFALARRLGGATEVLHGGSIVDALLDHAARSGISAIVIAARASAAGTPAQPHTHQQLIQRGAHYELTIVSTPERARGRAARCASWADCWAPAMSPWP